MPSIKPISELRNYNTVLREVTTDTPVFLTKNGLKTGMGVLPLLTFAHMINCAPNWISCPP